MFRLPSEKEEHKTTIGALILSIFIIIAGIGGMIYTKHESSEFKNSTDVRTLHATVYSCEQTKEKDDKGDRKEKYKVRFTYECFLLGIHTVRKVCGGYQPATAGF